MTNNPRSLEPILPRLDPQTRKPIKPKPDRRCIVDLNDGEPVQILCVSVVIRAGALAPALADIHASLTRAGLPVTVGSLDDPRMPSTPFAGSRRKPTRGEG